MRAFLAVFVVALWLYLLKVQLFLYDRGDSVWTAEGLAHSPPQPIHKRRKIMETRIALIGIIVENPDSVEQLNHLLHEYGTYIIGRMGIPYRERNVNIISVAMDAPQDIINALSGKIGRLDGIGAKTVYSNVSGNPDC